MSSFPVGTQVVRLASAENGEPQEVSATVVTEDLGDDNRAGVQVTNLDTGATEEMPAYWRGKDDTRDVFTVEDPLPATLGRTSRLATRAYVQPTGTAMKIWERTAYLASPGDALRPLPEWMGNVTKDLERWDDPNTNLPIGDHFTFDTWDRDRAGETEVKFQVFVPGYTERELADLWKNLDVKVHYRFGDMAVGYSTESVNRIGRVGNNVQYGLDLRRFDPFDWQRPRHEVPFRQSDNGYEVPFNFFFSVNGVELRPAPDQEFRGTYIGRNRP
jgi:hypothetical protein